MLLSSISTRRSIHAQQMNILVDVVDNIPHARIADFGIAIVTKNVDSIRTDTRQDVHTPRWSAPEIFLGQNPSKESDVYSFAMVTIEVYREQSEICVAFRSPLLHKHRSSPVKFRSVTRRRTGRSRQRC